MNRIKTFGLSALTFFSSLNMFGQAGYHKKCNGSLAWLSSTTETRGAPNPSAVVSPSGRYYGINQLDGYNVSRLIKYINSHDEYQALRGKLAVEKKKNEDGKTVYRVNRAKWQALGAAQPELFARAQEDFLCAVYLPECFQRLQKGLIAEAKKSGRRPIALRQLHPAVLSLFARSFVKKPATTAPLTALKNARTAEAANTEKFIIAYVGKNEYLKDKALASFRSADISWKEAQIAAACSLAEKEMQKYEAAEAERRQKEFSMLKKTAPLRQSRPERAVRRLSDAAQMPALSLKQKKQGSSRG